MTLLLVDDSRTALFHLESLLTDAGYADVRTAQSGAEALQLLTGDLGEQVDLVLLDMLMPDLDGVETCRRLKVDERLRDVPVIMVTAETETTQLAAALDAGAIDYIVKPANEVELLARVRAALRLKRETDARKERERVIESQRRQLEAELARAAQVQADLLPREAPALAGYDLWASCVPAREVGGDFYDWQHTADTLSLTVGDVMGKGMPAALLMATARAALRPAARRSDPATAVSDASAALEDDLARSSSFVTLFHARLTLTTGRLEYVDAGHGYAYVRRAGGEIEPLAAPEGKGLPLGVLAGEAYRAAEATLLPGDTLIVFSDGLAEERASGDVFAALGTAPLTGARDVVARLLAPLADDPAGDDVTVLALRRRD